MDTDTKRKAAHLYPETKEKLDGIKDMLQLKSDDQTVAFLCNYFLAGDNKMLMEYILTRAGK